MTTDSPAPRFFQGDRERACVLFLTLVSLLLHLLDLGGVFLWRDEGETLLLGRFTLHWGIPKAFDDGYTVCSNLAVSSKGWFVFLPWFQNYLAAFAIAIGGKNPFVLRLPFVCFGVACIPLTFLVARQLGLASRTRLAACALLALHVPFMLWNRNIRYYSQAAFFPLLLTWCYLRLIERKGRGWPLYGIVAFLTLHALGPISIAPLAAINLHLLIFERKKKNLLRRIWIEQACVVLAYVPYLFEALRGFRRFFSTYGGSLLGKKMTVGSFLSGAGLHLTYLIEYGFPLLVVLFLVAKKLRGKFSCKGSPASLFLLLAQAVGLCLLMSFIYNTQIAPPYMQAAIPVVAMLAAMALEAASGKSKKIFASLLAIAALTTALNLPLWPGKRPRLRDEVSYYRTNASQRLQLFGEHLFMRRIRVPLWNYFRLAFHHRQGPLEGLALYLNQHAAPGQTFYATADVQATHFVTGLRRIDQVPFPQEPDWLIWRNRASGCSLGMGACDVEGACQADQTVRLFLNTHVYEQIVLDYPDWSQENQPVLEFLLDWDETDDTKVDRLVIFRRVAPDEKPETLRLPQPAPEAVP